MLKRYLALDLETTGISPKTDRIIEIGAVLMENGVGVKTFHKMVNPRMQVPEKVVSLTGITNEMLASEWAIDSCIQEFAAFDEGLPLVGHHIIFDYSFMKRAMHKSGFSYERAGLDTLKLSRKFLPRLEHKNLAAVCRELGICLSENHRALADALAAAQVYEELKKRFYAKGDMDFSPNPLIYTIKKEKTMTKQQKECLQYLVKCHKIELAIDIDSLNRSEASRLTDQILSQYGRVIYSQKG